MLTWPIIEVKRMYSFPKDDWKFRIYRPLDKGVEALNKAIMR
jgi:hypothetical protein